MINYAPEIKSRVSMIDVCNQYGFEINRSGFCRCPFHADRKPSMKVYPGQRGYFCYVCHDGGDIIAFTQKYFNLTFKAALAKLNNDFFLGLPINDDADEEKRRFSASVSAFKKKEVAEAYQKRLDYAQLLYDLALNLYAYLDVKRMSHEPFSNEYTDAVTRLPIAKYQLDTAEMELVSIEQEKGR